MQSGSDAWEAAKNRMNRHVLYMETRGGDLSKAVQATGRKPIGKVDTVMPRQHESKRSL